MKDKVVNIPVYETDILKTLGSLPRTPEEAEIVPVNLKRKIDYKNCHKVQYISVPNILKALETLRESENPYYQFAPDIKQFQRRCKAMDTEG